MINDALVFLKNRLNAHLKLGLDPSESLEDLVVFLDGGSSEPVAFKLGAVTVLLINVEEENTLRGADRYVQQMPDGKQRKVSPEIRLNLRVLFVARFKQYEDSLSYLSKIIQFFQAHHILDHQNSPGLSPAIERLVTELVTMPLSEQNDIWSALRAPYQPSVYYKVNMVVFRSEPEPEKPAIEEQSVQVSQ
jgi:hypothetical protein